MKLKLFSFVAVGAALLGAALIASHHESGHAKQAKVGQLAPNFTLTSAAGNEHSLSDFAGKVVVLEWVNHSCPFVKKHYNSGNMQQLQQEYTDKGIIWLSICSSAEGKQGYMEPAAIQQARNSIGAKSTAYLVDASGDVGRAYGASATPEMYVINTDGTLVYHGAIDSKATADEADIEGATNYVAQAIDAIMDGEEVPTAMTRAYGCSVKY